MQILDFFYTFGLHNVGTARLSILEQDHLTVLRIRQVYYEFCDLMYDGIATTSLSGLIN